MVTTGQLMFGGSYATGASKTTAYQPLVDGNIDKRTPYFAKEVRKQIKWLNVNGTDIPSITQENTKKTIGVSVSTQVESPSKTFNDQAEKVLEFHRRKGVGELTNFHHFNKSLRLISNFEQLDGGILIRHHYSIAKYNSGQWKFPYRYELVGIDMIDITKTTVNLSQEPTETTINGLVRNKYGQLTHIWIYTTEDKSISKPVPYSELTYFSDTWISVDQHTAVSKLVSLLKTLDQSILYGDATLKAAIEQAKSGAFLHSQAYNEIMKVVSDVIAANTAGGNKEDIAKAIDLVSPVLEQLSNLGIKPQGLTPVASDDTITFDTTKRDNQYKSLNDNNEMKMSSSVGLSDIGVYKKASDANYSSIKATIEMDQQTADIRFDNIKNEILYEIDTRVIQTAIQIGMITERVAYWKNPYVFNKFRYLRLNKIDIEPAKNALANKTNIELGIDTKAEIVERTKGVKFEDFIAKEIEQAEFEADQQLALEIKLLKKRKEAFEKAGLEMPEATQEKKQENNKSTQALYDIVVKDM